MFIQTSDARYGRGHNEEHRGYEHTVYETVLEAIRDLSDDELLRYINLGVKLKARPAMPLPPTNTEQS